MKPSALLAAGGWLNASALIWAVLLGWVERGGLAATALLVFVLVALIGSAIASTRKPNVSAPVIRRNP